MVESSALILQGVCQRVLPILWPAQPHSAGGTQAREENFFRPPGGYFRVAGLPVQPRFRPFAWRSEANHSLM